MKVKNVHTIKLGRLHLYNAGILDQQAQTNHILERLTLFDAQFGCSRGNTYRYIYAGDNLFPLCRFFSSRKAVAEALASAIRERSFPVLVELPFLCRLISISTNARVFEYNSRRELTAKVALKNVFRIGRLAREIRARKVIAEKGKLRAIIPRIIEYDRSGGNWIVEENVSDARSVSLEEKAAEFLDCYARPFYRATSRPVSLAKNRVGGPALYIDLPLKNMIIKHEKFSYYALWPFALCHGDLSPLNMIKSESGRFCLIDWEFAAHKPVAYDLCKIYRSYPALRAKVIALLEDLSGGSDRALRPELQIAAALGMRYADARLKIETQIKEMRSGQEKISGEFNDMLSDKLELHKTLISELLESC